MKTNLVDMVAMLKGAIFPRHFYMSATGIDSQYIKFIAAFFSGAKIPQYALLRTGDINTLKKNDCVFFSSGVQFAGVNFTQNIEAISKGRISQKKTKEIKQERETKGVYSSSSYFPVFFRIFTLHYLTFER